MNTKPLDAIALDKAAHEKYHSTKILDPFPEIYPALLSASDIIKYVEATGMISPFYADSKQKHLKQASYAVRMLGKCIYWDEDGKKQEFDIKEKQEFTLKRNSIAFVSLEPRFRIPYYIALRFNLKITHIHRGLLLGTGPLIDPGFDGKLAIPLHNLTTNDYVLRGGDDLIWVEFTKLNIDNEKLKDSYVEFNPNKNISDVNDYLHKAYNGHPIRSSIPYEINKAISIANSAKNRVKLITLGGILTVFGLVYGMFLPTHQIVEDTATYVKASQLELNQLRDYKDRISALEKEVNKLKSEKNTKIIKKETKIIQPPDYIIYKNGQSKQ